MSIKILMVEDEAAIREMVCFTITQAGYQVSEAESVADARVAIADSLPDLILLDWMLPGVSGIEYARALKKDEMTKHIPIIMLTARGDEFDKIRGFEVGADDYITKPFSVKELQARIKAVLRRSVPALDEEVIDVDGLQLDMSSHRVMANGRSLEMGPTEFRMLHFFMSHLERVFSRGQLLDRVWGGNVYIDERTVDVHIRRLRKALEPEKYDRYVQTVRGAGYRFSTKV
ncbi:MAG: phosphate regulon transcriptional regulator PhoB [Gammaproteobacteria bacterium]|nr:phosphate regulon transcriptional regulator PhoB [Gammaproteobacteria bacterium]MCF6229576.1 phosphate regulon transcriptional regulator PhoB [Gammaproteobacteria bacterium]